MKKDDFLDLMDDHNRKSRSKLSGIPRGKNNFNKADICKYVAEQACISQATAKKAVDSLCDFIKLFASDTDSCVTIAGFGSFRTKKYKYRSTLRGKRYQGTGKKMTFTPSKN